MTTIQEYHQILYPHIPEFLMPYLDCPCLTRLKGIGLFCGIDYSASFHPSLFYSRFDHSLGVALITWRLIQHKLATLAALFHDISTPVFSHVIDFKNKDYLNQESTERANASMILADTQLITLLENNQIDPNHILYDHIYPIANQKTPHICADRLEYMFATGLFLTHSFDLDTITKCINDLAITINEDGLEEPSFQHIEIAQIFFECSLVVSQLFLDYKNKITLELLAQIVDIALHQNILKTEDLYTKSELEVLHILENCHHSLLQTYLKTFKHQTQIWHSNQPQENCFFAKLKVKVRYIDPLCHQSRLSNISQKTREAIEHLFMMEDNYICLPLL